MLVVIVWVDVPERTNWKSRTRRPRMERTERMLKEIARSRSQGLSDLGEALSRGREWENSSLSRQQIEIVPDTTFAWGDVSCLVFGKKGDNNAKLRSQLCTEQLGADSSENRGPS